MAKKSFLSFHYASDGWRVAQIKNIGAVDEQPILSTNEWEAVKKKGDEAIKAWIDSNMKGRDCLIVLVGSDTASRRWVKYEVKRAAENGMGVFGIYIHKLKDSGGLQTTMGSDPFSGVKVGATLVSSYAKMYDPPFQGSTYVYDHISQNIASWIDGAISART